MSSAWRNATVAVVVVAAATTAWRADALAEAAEAFIDARQEGFFGRERRRAQPMADYSAKAGYDGRFAFTRLRYGSASDLAGGRFRREPTWAHDFPRAEFNFLKILSELTLVPSFVEQGNVMTLDDSDLSLFPIAYMSEPGFWSMTEAEAAGLRAYLQKGGFIIFDDFRGHHIDNLFAQMRHVLPEARFQLLDATHPVFHSFFEINQLDPRSGYYSNEGDAEWWGIFEANDPRQRLIAIANNNHDLGELWEFSDTGYVPVDLSNEAYKFGVNYVIYGLTH